MSDTTELVPSHGHSMIVPPLRSDMYKVRYADGAVRLVDHCTLFGWSQEAAGGAEWSWREPVTEEARTALCRAVQKLLEQSVHVLVDNMYHVSEFSAPEPFDDVWENTDNWFAGDYLQLEMENDGGAMQWEFSMSQLCVGYMNWLHMGSFTLHTTNDEDGVCTSLDFFRRVRAEPDPSVLKLI